MLLLLDFLHYLEFLGVSQAYHNCIRVAAAVEFSPSLESLAFLKNPSFVKSFTAKTALAQKQNFGAFF